MHESCMVCSPLCCECSCSISLFTTSSYSRIPYVVFLNSCPKRSISRGIPTSSLKFSSDKSEQIQSVFQATGQHTHTTPSDNFAIMTNKYSSPFDGPDHFEVSQDNLDVHDVANNEEPSDEHDQPLLGHGPDKKLHRKRACLKSLVRSGSKTLNKMSENISAQMRREPKSAGRLSSTPSTSARSASHWEYDRFHGSVPDSIPELLIHLDRGRHPEILELAIESKRRLTPSAEHKTLEYKILGAMLITIRDRRQNKELDAIQSQTLEQLGRPYEYTRFQ